MIKKKWKRIKDYPNYKISNYGEVYSFHFKRTIKPYTQKQGKSLRVMLRNINGSKSISLANLVIKYFDKDWSLNKQYALHLDYNRSNNIETNLECTTRGDLLRYWHRYRNKIRGIYDWNIGHNKFRVALKHKDKVKTVGYYKTKDEALMGYYNAYLALYKEEPFKLTA